VDQVPATLAAVLGSVLPQGGPLEPTVTLLQLTDRPMSLGELRGVEQYGPFGSTELHGGRVEAVVRFDVPGDSANAANGNMLTLQGKMLGSKASLWAAGVLEVESVAGAPSIHDNGSWTRSADYRVLFEYRLAPAVEAESLIARIPIRVDQGVGAGVVDETVITDDLIRWDDVDAPTLVLRGVRSVAELQVAFFLAGASPSGSVTLRRTHDDATGAPTVFPTLAEFLAAVNVPGAPPPAPHAQFAFPTFAEFIGAFTPAGTSFVLGDRDGNGMPDSYQGMRMALAPSIRLPSARDRLEVSADVSPLDQVAVIYLRASGPSS